MQTMCVSISLLQSLYFDFSFEQWVSWFLTPGVWHLFWGLGQGSCALTLPAGSGVLTSQCPVGVQSRFAQCSSLHKGATCEPSPPLALPTPLFAFIISCSFCFLFLLHLFLLFLLLPPPSYLSPPSLALSPFSSLPLPPLPPPLHLLHFKENKRGGDSSMASLLAQKSEISDCFSNDGELVDGDQGWDLGNPFTLCLQLDSLLYFELNMWFVRDSWVLISYPSGTPCDK